MPLFGHRSSWEVGHLWSLSVEEHFYLIWPVVLARLVRSRALAILVVVLAAASSSLIERSFLRLKDRIARPTPGRTYRPHIASGAGGISRAGRQTRAVPG
jgi:peptidoglycan/LPS O-acetylase OafA/YrhL